MECRGISFYHTLYNCYLTPGSYDIVLPEEPGGFTGIPTAKARNTGIIKVFTRGQLKPIMNNSLGNIGLGEKLAQIKVISGVGQAKFHFSQTGGGYELVIIYERDIENTGVYFLSNYGVAAIRHQFVAG